MYTVLEGLGYPEELISSLTYPILTINGKAYLGTDSIQEMCIRDSHKVGDAKGVGQADVRPGAVVKGRGSGRGKIPVAEFPPLVPQNLFSCHSFFSFYPFS